MTVTHFAILMTNTGLTIFSKKGKLYELYNYNNGEVFAKINVFPDGTHNEEILSDFTDDLSGCLLEIVSEFSHTTKSIPHEYDGDFKHSYSDIKGWKKRKERNLKINELGI